MKKTVKAKTAQDDLLEEYPFDYSKARPNRFAVKSNAVTKRTIVLDADVARVFKTDQSVNQFLRALITALPQFSK